MNNRDNKFTKFRPLLILLAILFGFVIYAYGFDVTQVNLNETREETRKQSLVRIIRTLAQPDILTYEKEVVKARIPFYIPCQSSAITNQEQDNTQPYITVSPECANPGDSVVVSGFNFFPNQVTTLNFIPPSNVNLGMATFNNEKDGSFEIKVKLPERPSDEMQYIEAVSSRNVGTPAFSQAAKDTWQKIIETIFLALLATTIGVIIAIPLSFFAARLIMKDVQYPFVTTALFLILVPIGLWAGSFLAKQAQWVSGYLSRTTLISLISFIALSGITFLLVRTAFSGDDSSVESKRTKRTKTVLSIIIALISLILLSLFSGLMMKFGSFLMSILGGFAFIGKFIRDMGDLLGMIISMVAAIAGAGVMINIAGKFGEFSLRKIPEKVNKLLGIILALIAGAVVGAIVGSAVEWLYQIGEPLKTHYIPMAILAGLGLLAGILIKPTKQLSVGMAVCYASRTVFNVLRAIEPLIMGIVFVIWVGIGPFAGVLALALHTIAGQAKYYYEAVESILPGPMEAIRATGANRLQTIIYAVIPQVIPPYISFTMYRWDINVRMSTIIGFVGGGGVGFLLQQNIQLMNYRGAAVQMIAIAIVVATMDYLSSKLIEKSV